MIHKRSLEEVQVYGFCSMMHRYRYVLGLPWFPVSAETGWAKVARSLARIWFRSLTYPAARNSAARHMEKVMTSSVRMLDAQFPRDGSLINRLRIEHRLAQEALENTFIYERDKPIGFDVPAIVTLRKTVSIEGTMDFVFRRDILGPVPSIVVLSYSSVEDPIEEYTRTGSVRQGFAYAAVLQSNPKTAVQFQSVPMIAKADGLTTIGASHSVSFTSLALQADAGIQASVAIPTAPPGKCVHCPYQSFCTVRHATAKPQDMQPYRDQLERERSKSPIALWSPDA